MTEPVTVTDADWQSEVLQSDTPVLVDFWAEWCGPCRMVAPVLEEIAAEKDGELKVAKLNIDDNPDTPRSYGIMSIPTLMVVADGEEKRRIVGAKGKAQLLEEVGQAVG